MLRLPAGFGAFYAWSIDDMISIPEPQATPEQQQNCALVLDPGVNTTALLMVDPSAEASVKGTATVDMSTMRRSSAADLGWCGRG